MIWNYRVEGDDVTRTAKVYDVQGALIETRPYTELENAEADSRAAEATASNNETVLRQEGITEIVKIEAAVDELATLLGDNTTPGSIRFWRSGVTNTYDAATIRNIADILLKEAQVTRILARQTLRLARVVLDATETADVGAEL